MVLRDTIYVLERTVSKDEYGGNEIVFTPIQKVLANVRIFFSQNEDGLQNRQGLPHLEGSLITRDKLQTKYFEYEGDKFQIMVRNPQSKQFAYKFREIKHG